MLDLNLTLPSLQTLSMKWNRLKIFQITPNPSHQLECMNLVENDIRDPELWFWSYENRNKTYVSVKGSYPTCDCHTQEKLLEMNKNLEENENNETIVKELSIEYCAFMAEQRVIIPLRELVCSHISTNECEVYPQAKQPERFKKTSILFDCTFTENFRFNIYNQKKFFSESLLRDIFFIYSGNRNVTSLERLSKMKVSEYTMQSGVYIYIYAEKCNIQSINLENLPQQGLTHLYLADNSIREIEFPVLQKLKEMNTLVKFGRNPINCDCEHQEMFNAILGIKNLIQDWDEMRCEDGTAIDGHRELCVAPQTVFLVLGIICFAILTLALLIYLRYTLEVQVYIYSRGWFPSVFRPEPDDQTYQYDVFLSYSEKDEDFVVYVLDFLEKQVQPPYKVCHHHRDWIVGERIDRQVSE